jgi:hypothetical protein
MNAGGTITGRPTTAGTYVVTITVQRSGETAVFMFRWTVT